MAGTAPAQKPRRASKSTHHHWTLDPACPSQCRSSEVFVFSNPLLNALILPNWEILAADMPWIPPAHFVAPAVRFYSLYHALAS